MIAGGSGVGKSVLSHWNAVYAGVPTLYMSADSHQGTMANRTASMRSGEALDESERQIEAGEGRAWEELRAASHIRWCFEPSPSVQDIHYEMGAFYTVYGQFPALVVVDNLRNIQGDDEQSVVFQETIQELHELARKTGAHVNVLHHVVGDYDSGDKPVPQNGLEQKLSKIPEMILTLNRQGVGKLNVAIVKNRNPYGRHEVAALADGSHSVLLDVDFLKMQLY